MSNPILHYIAEDGTLGFQWHGEPINGVNYPADIGRTMSVEELKEIGLMPLPDAGKPSEDADRG